MPISQGSIKQRIDDNCKGPMGVTEDAKFEANMSTPMSGAFNSSVFSLQISVPTVPQPPLPAQPATIAGLTEPDAQGFVLMAMLATPGTDPAYITDFSNAMGSAFFNILTSHMTVDCPLNGGPGTINLEQSDVEAEVDACKSTMGVTEEGTPTWEKFALPFAAALFDSIKTDMTVTFPPLGGLGVIA